MKSKSALFKGNIIDLLRSQRDGKDLISRYFHRDSSVVKAITKHIYAAKPCLLVDRPYYNNEEMKVKTNSASVDINFRSATACGVLYNKDNKSYEADYFFLEMQVEYEGDETEGDIERTYVFKVPIDLEENFTQEKFDAWVKFENENNRKKALREDLPKLKTLLRQYPLEAQKFLSEID